MQSNTTQINRSCSLVGATRSSPTGMRKRTRAKFGRFPHSGGCLSPLTSGAEGEIFVSSISSEVSVYSYDEGLVNYVGKGHSGIIKNLKISPCQKYVISVCDEGGIFVWRLPANI